MAHSNLPRIVISTGEPAGIGPDITIQISQQHINADITAIGDPDLLRQRAELMGLPLKLFECDASSNKHAVAGELKIIPLKTARSVTAGQLDRHNSDYVLQQLETAYQGCRDKKFDAIVTAPVQKSIINDAGYSFSGHTEFFADLCDSKPVMMLADSTLRVALVTTHLPLSEVAAAITEQHLTEVLEIVHRELQNKFLLKEPAILVCGLNPHAGEDGHLGKEEKNIITPTLNKLRKQGMNLTGPQAADTAFTKTMIRNSDIIVAMYHDQGLPALKAIGFNEIANITLGLPIIRTSVDHGTALNLAGTGLASSSSLMQAIRQALQIAENTVT